MQDVNQLPADALVPFPRTVNDLKKLYEEGYNTEESWKGKRFRPNIWQTSRPGPKRITSPLDYYYWPLNFYLAERSRVQLHIACDKLASSLLSYYGKRKHGMGRIVNYNYMQVATLPTLYYSALSGAIAAMSAFGACSLRHENLEDQEQMNIIRSTMGFVLVKRSAYLQQTCNKNGRWHDQIWILYNHLINQGYELNIISLDTVRALKRHRELFDYRLLGQPSLSKGYGSDTYFNLVPKVLDSLDSCESIVASILPVEEQREISPRIAAMRKLYSELK